MVGRHGKGRSDGGLNLKTAGGWLLVATVAAVLVAGFVYLTERRAETAQLDPNTFCPRSGPTSVQAVLIDRSDPLTELQLEALRRHVMYWAEQVPKYGALRIYEVGVGGALLRPTVDICNPGDGSDASTINSNPTLLRKRYRDKFLGPLELMLSAMRTDREQATSPILEAIQAISIRDFGVSGPAGDKGLIIVSDLLEHGPNVSFYKEIPDAERFARSPIGRSLHADLAGVNASIFLMTRVKDASHQTDALGSFWIHWLELEGAAVTHFKPMPG